MPVNNFITYLIACVCHDSACTARRLNGHHTVLIEICHRAPQFFCFCMQGPRCVLAGDHLQLPPTIQSAEAEKKGMGKTLFERLTEAYGDQITSMLTIQYRMHELIMNWSSKELYNNKVHFPLVFLH